MDNKQIITGKTPLSYEERVRWFFNNYYETGMEYRILLDTMRNEDLDNFLWYNDIIQIPKYKEDIEPSGLHENNLRNIKSFINFKKI